MSRCCCVTQLPARIQSGMREGGRPCTVSLSFRLLGERLHSVRALPSAATALTSDRTTLARTSIYQHTQQPGPRSWLAVLKEEGGQGQPATAANIPTNHPSVHALVRAAS
ncbi:hypothetical protein NDU88_006165 [Pleurodeles waltl]|uniref:Uncharacterized protein n=1 Tax=Pleurodeles waltl TaxID=8319 RepID=A0AAV7WWT1_PLEWA|nr:hypothetical protein NDU88_006165 [Pleurodeles waltl]